MITTRRLATLVALGLLMAVPAVASASSGRLVVVPRHGPGLVTVAPGGGHLRRICTDVSLCGRPSAYPPSVAPDGEGIAYIDRRSHRPVIVAPGGTCLWCLEGKPLPAARPGSRVAFEGDDAIAAGSRQFSLTGGRARTISPVPAGQVSARNENAIVRHGWILVRALRGGRFRRLARGSSPARRRGWWGSRRPRRRTRGRRSSPAQTATAPCMRPEPPRRRSRAAHGGCRTRHGGRWRGPRR